MNSIKDTKLKLKENKSELLNLQRGRQQQSSNLLSQMSMPK
jgi:hypothetical protein